MVKHSNGNAPVLTVKQLVICPDKRTATSRTWALHVLKNEDRTLFWIKPCIVPMIVTAHLPHSLCLQCAFDPETEILISFIAFLSQIYPGFTERQAWSSIRTAMLLC